jgi:OOP family OmpA-OmpF porin
MNKFLYFLTILLLAAPVSKTLAEPGDWYIAPQIVFTDDDGERLLDDQIGGGQIAGGYEINDVFFVEGHIGYSDLDGYLGIGQEHLDISVNVLSRLNPEGRFSPFILAGAGYLGTETSTGSEENRPSATVGVGFLWAFNNSPFSVRGEYRARFAIESGNNLTDRISSLGVQYSFGRKSPERIVDTDNDGVPDYADQCLNSEPGVQVDSVGCEIFVDTDGDGVMDRKDLCPDTPAGMPVDEYGCLSDNDQDGVTDDIDECPNTVSGATVNPNGCERDDDNDGVVNHRDNCPDSRPGVRVDVYGCEIVDIIELRGVNFATNSDRLLAGAEQVIDDAIAWLRQHPGLIVEVAGHTDNDGNDILNLGLSERRANTVRDYMINNGISPDNLSAQGFGESQPVSDNDTPEGKAENRRVELRILNR